MATISSLGTGSGIDLAGLVDQLVAAEGGPATARFDRTEASIQAKLSAFGTLKGALSSFQSSLSSLAQSPHFRINLLVRLLRQICLPCLGLRQPFPVLIMLR